MPPPSVTVCRSSPAARQNLEKALAALRKTDVLIGIPADRALRKDDEIDNASLLYIHTHGSLLKGIPPRPTVEPGIENSRALWAPELAAAGKAMLDRQPTQVTIHLRRAGMIATNAVKRMFGSSDLAPNAPSTIRRKKSSKPLIDNGQLKRAITFVIRQGKPETAQAATTEHIEAEEIPQEASRGLVRTIVSDVEEAATLGGEAAELIL